MSAGRSFALLPDHRRMLEKRMSPPLPTVGGVRASERNVTEAKDFVHVIGHPSAFANVISILLLMHMKSVNFDAA